MLRNDTQCNHFVVKWYYVVSALECNICLLKKRKGSELLVSLTIGNKLKTLRKGRKLTQQELSEKIGLSRATISNYEVGRRSPHLSELRRFAEFFGVGLDYFGVETVDESFELLSRAKSVFCNEDIPKEEREEIYKKIMRIYLGVE